MKTSRARTAAGRTAAVVARAAGAAGAGLVAALVVLLTAAPAQAQFQCTVTATDQTCTNSGTSVGPFANGTGTPNQTVTTINSGTAGGFVSNTAGGGNAIATNTGSSNFAGGDGVSAVTVAGGNAIATNSGSATGTNRGVSALTFGGGNAVILNSGTSSSSANTGLVAFASGGAGGSATVINTGTNSGIAGILAQASGAFDATIVNSGHNSGDIHAIATGGNAVVTNSGSTVGRVISQGNGGFNSIVINSGNITGQVLAGGSFGSNVIVTNSGSITGQVILSAGNTEVLTNSGTIGNFGGTAITFTGGPDTLNVLPGSNIIGAINLTGANDKVNFFTANQSLTFNTLAGATVTSTVPFVVAGNQAATIDPTPFGLADKNLMDFTRGVSGMLDSLGGSVGPSGPISSAFAPSEPGSFAARVEDTFAAIPGLAYASDQAVVFKAPTTVTADGRAVWARGFGGERTQEPDGLLLGAHTSFFGGAVGFDLLARGDLRLGLFGGGGASRMTLDSSQGSTHTDTAFGGLYGRWGFVSLGLPSFLDFALHGGGSNNTTSRTVSNNLVAGGIEIATASYASSYISPELKYGINVPLGARFTLTPSLRVRYVAGFFDGYTEAGTTAPLTVASRTFQGIEERGEVKLTHAQPVGPDLLLTSVHVGAIGVQNVGGAAVDTVLLGVNLPFVTPGRNDVGGLVGGGGLEWRTRDGVSVFGSAEVIGFSDQSTVWSARGGFRVAF